MNNRVLIVLVLGVLLIGIGFFVWSSRPFKQPALRNPETKKLEVATSFYSLYFFASEIGKEKADVINITPYGAEPHDYEPTSQDIARIEKSDILILNGGVELWADKIKDNLKDKDVAIIIAGEGALTKHLTEKGETSADPHIWLDPQLAKVEVEKIRDGFKKKDPANISTYDVNASILENKLDQLDAEFKQGLSSCQKKDIITSHIAFVYLASRYGLNQVGVAGISPDEEPSPKQLADIADFAKQNNVKYIFFETLISPKLAETIAQEIGAKTLVLDPLEGLSEDDIKGGKNYFTVMQDNLKNLQTALGCKIIQTP